jgi:hypothetical protein
MIILDKFPHIKKTKSLIISHVKYINSKISQVCNNPNTKIINPKWNMQLLKNLTNTCY